MLKKNESTNYTQDMQNKKPFLPMAQQYIQLVLTITSVVVVLASLWLGSKLAPLAQDISLLHQRVNAQERRQIEISTTLQTVQSDTSQIKSDVSEIKGFLKGRDQQP